MNEKIKYLGKLSLSIGFTYSKLICVFILSVILAILSIVFFCLQFTENESIIVFFNLNWKDIIFVFLSILCSIIVFVLMNKYIIEKLIFRIIQDKGQIFLNPIISKILEKTVKNEEHKKLLLEKDKSLIKAKLLEELKSENENRWFKKAIFYLLNRIDFNKEDIKDEHNFSDVIKLKTHQIIQDIVEPDLWPMFLILIIQIVLLYFMK